MFARRVAILLSCAAAAAGCAPRSSPLGGFDPAGLPPGRAALVRGGGREALFVFPAPDSLRPCGFRRAGEPHLGLYIWTVNVTGGPQRRTWYAVNVWPAVPDDSAGRPPALAAVLRAARPVVATVAGEPPMTSGIVDSTGVEAHAVDGRVVVRLIRPATVRRLFAARPPEVQFVACHGGDDDWTREVPVRYEP